MPRVIVAMEIKAGQITVDSDGRWRQGSGAKRNTIARAHDRIVTNANLVALSAENPAQHRRSYDQNFSCASWSPAVSDLTPDRRSHQPGVPRSRHGGGP